jgi:hypothetical protein
MSFDTTINKSLSVARSKEYNPQNLLFFFGIRFFVVSLSLSARLAAFAMRLRSLVMRGRCALR